MHIEVRESCHFVFNKEITYEFTYPRHACHKSYEARKDELLRTTTKVALSCFST